MLKRLRDRLLNAELPTRWEGLSAAQYVAVAPVVWRGGAAWEVRARMLWGLLQLSWRSPLRTAAFLHALSNEERVRLARNAAQPLLDQTSHAATVLNALRVGRHRLEPLWSDQLNHIDAETWGAADAHFLRYLEGRDLDQLRYLVARTWVLRRGRHRLPLEGPRVELVNRLSEDQLLAVAAQWSRQRRLLERECPTVFAKGQGQARGKGGWGDVLLSLSGGAFGPYAQTKATPARAFLHQLERLLKQHQAA